MTNISQWSRSRSALKGSSSICICKSWHQHIVCWSLDCVWSVMRYLYQKQQRINLCRAWDMSIINTEHLSVRLLKVFFSLKKVKQSSSQVQGNCQVLILTTIVSIHSSGAAAAAGEFKFGYITTWVFIRFMHGWIKTRQITQFLFPHRAKLLHNI